MPFLVATVDQAKSTAWSDSVGAAGSAAQAAMEDLHPGDAGAPANNLDISPALFSQLVVELSNSYPTRYSVAPPLTLYIKPPLGKLRDSNWELLSRSGLGTIILPKIHKVTYNIKANASSSIRAASYQQCNNLQIGWPRVRRRCSRGQLAKQGQKGTRIHTHTAF